MTDTFDPFFRIQDLGRQTVVDADGKTFEAYVSKIVCTRCEWEAGTNQVDVTIAPALGADPVAFRLAEDKAYVHRARQVHRCPR